MIDIQAVSPDANFLADVAERWVEAAGIADRSVSEGTIFVPSRRAARALSGEFLRASGLNAVVLPKIVPLNAIDESALFFQMGLRLAPAISDIRRINILASLILSWNGQKGAPETLAGAMRLARDLAALMDEARRWEVDLHAALPGIVEGDLAEHWHDTVQFLNIVTHALPAVMAEEGVITAESRRILLMDAQAQHWESAGAEILEPVWLIGVAFATPPLARFAKAIAKLPGGRLVLSGYDATMPSLAWDEIAPGSVNPYSGFKRLFQDLGCSREHVAASGVEAGRADYVRRAFLPASMLADWQNASPDTHGITLLSSQDEFEEARAIAAALRDAVQDPSKTAALVTPDRIQAQRVSAELKRLGIMTEDSAGILLGETPPALFIRLIAEAFSAEFAPIQLVAMTGNPFFTLDHGPAAARKLARSLEMEVLRPLHPAAGLDQIALACGSANKDKLTDFVLSIRAAFSPLLDLSPDAKFPVSDLFARLVEVADNLSGGGDDLWSGDTGGALSSALTDFVAAGDVLPDVRPAEIADIFLSAVQDERIRRPRSHDAHARVAIWGILEARLQSVDTIFIGGLTEGVFPAAADPGPWFSRPMRRAAGLPSPEDAVAEAAHDFVSLIQAAPEVVLCVPHRIGGSPAVPSRFVARLDSLASGRGKGLAKHPASGWVKLMDTPQVKIDRPRPTPLPPSWARPTSYSITDITTLMHDPYAVYARKVLGIADVNKLDDAADPALFGTIVHDGFAAFLRSGFDSAAPGAGDTLFQCMAQAFPPGRPSAAVRAWWLARLKRLSTWLVAQEIERDASKGPAIASAFEASGEWEINHGRFKVRARADRIEARSDDMGLNAVSFIDYKTGKPPTSAAVETGGAPQLVIEAAMASLGCFGEEFVGVTRELSYWHLSGGAVEGKISPLFPRAPSRIPELVDTAIQQIPALLEHFARDDVPYLDQPHPGRSGSRGRYSGVSRRAEWDVNR